MLSAICGLSELSLLKELYIVITYLSEINKRIKEKTIFLGIRIVITQYRSL